MKAIITGANGTVGQRLKQHLKNIGWQVVAWNRQDVPIDDYASMETFVRDEAPDVVFHLATASQPTGRPNESWLVNYEWTSELAWICQVLNVRFVFTSSVLVFTDEASGPFTPESLPNATTGYGYEKRAAEERVFYQNPQAVVARIGWQIGEAAGSNNMLDFFERQLNEHGQINASTRWYPACSFIADTVVTLIHLSQMTPGLYLVDANLHWTFYEIALAIKAQHNYSWIISPNESFVYDQRMRDPRVPIAPLHKRLATLSAKP